MKVELNSNIIQVDSQLVIKLKIVEINIQVIEMVVVIKE
jgi:hypothetical protein